MKTSKNSARPSPSGLFKHSRETEVEINEDARLPDRAREELHGPPLIFCIQFYIQNKKFLCMGTMENHESFRQFTVRRPVYRDQLKNLLKT